MKSVEAAGRGPKPYMPALKAADVKVIHKCTSFSTPEGTKHRL